MLKASAFLLQNRRTKLNLKEACMKTILTNIPYFVELKGNPFEVLPSTLREDLLSRLSAYLKLFGPTGLHIEVQKLVFAMVKKLIWRGLKSFDFALCCNYNGKN